MRAVAYPADRERLLANGEMRMPLYSSRPAEEAGRYAYREMTDAAGLMGLLLSEPVMEVDEFTDCWGGRIVTVRAAAFDALQPEEVTAASAAPAVNPGLGRCLPRS